MCKVLSAVDGIHVMFILKIENEERVFKSVVSVNGEKYTSTAG